MRQTGFAGSTQSGPAGATPSEERIDDANHSAGSHAMPQATSAAQTSQAATTSFVLRK
jgi:hypothetical protein